MCKEKFCTKNPSQIVGNAGKPVRKPGEDFDFVSKYVNLISRVTDASPEFLEACGLFLLSVAVGRKWVFQSGPEMTIFGDNAGKGGRFLNLWFVLLAPSRLGRKSTVIKHLRDLTEKVFGIHRILTEIFTPESLIEQMSKMSLRSVAGRLETVCCWISDEIAWFFQHLRKSDSYMAGVDSFLSSVYDGRDFSRSTIGRGKEMVESPYLTCFLASTNSLPTLFNEFMVQFGFLNRFFFIIEERSHRKPLRIEPLTEHERKEAEEIEDFLEALAKRTSTTVMTMTNEARALYDNYEKKVEDTIEKKELGIREGYYGNLPNFVIRLSCLYRLSRMEPNEIRSYTSSVLPVTPQDVKKAIFYAWKAWGWFEKVIDIMHKPKAHGVKGILTGRGRHLAVEILKKGPKKREHLLLTTRKYGIKDTLLDNVILPSLIRDNIIKRDKFGWYSLVTESPNNTQGGDKNHG